MSVKGVQSNDYILQIWGKNIADNLEQNLVIARGNLPFSVVALRKAYYEAIVDEHRQNTLSAQDGYLIYVQTYGSIANIVEDNEAEKIQKLHQKVQRAFDKNKLGDIAQEDIDRYATINLRINEMCRTYMWELLDYLDDIDRGGDWLKGVQAELLKENNKGS